MIKVNNIKYVIDNYNIPTLIIEGTDAYGESCRRYLSEFRKYSIQCSYTIDGEGDAGSSPVFPHMKDIMKMMSDDEAFYFIRMLMKDALDGRYDMSSFKIPNTWFGMGDETIREWIIATVKFFKG